MKYNIDKINLIAQKVAEVVKEAMEAEGQEQILIGDVELVIREGLLKIGQQALKWFLESADGEAKAEMACIDRSSRTVKSVHAAQRGEKKALWSGLYLRCATWSVLL